jgi:hypothetical protein
MYQIDQTSHLGTGYISSNFADEMRKQVSRYDPPGDGLGDFFFAHKRSGRSADDQDRFQPGHALWSHIIEWSFNDGSASVDIENGHRSREGRHFRSELDRARKAQAETASSR